MVIDYYHRIITSYRAHSGPKSNHLEEIEHF